MDDQKVLLQTSLKYAYVSFDLFDTIMIRTFDKPSDVWNAVELCFNKSNNNKIKYFSKKRYKAELEARKHTSKEITIDEIYQYLPFDQKTKFELEELEKKIEIDNCVPNEPMIQMLKSLQEKGKEILITTDMYLDEKTIRAILAKLDIHRYKLYLSSDIGVTKVEGKLFKYILNDLNISSDEMIHFGDNSISDIEMAKANGIECATRVKRNPKSNPNAFLYNVRKFEKNPAYIHIKNIIDHNYEDSMEYRIGFGVLGPVLVEFCIWLHDMREKYDVNEILFVSREGYLINKIYEALYPEDGDIGYVYLNKNLLRMPMLYLNPSVENFLNTLPMKDNYTIDEFSESLGVSVDNIKKCGCTDEVLERGKILSGAYNRCFESLFDELKPVLKEQYELLIRYLAEKRIVGRSIFLVNNSINGNGQKMLEAVLENLDENSYITGVQFVKSRKCKKSLGNHAISWISDEEKLPVRTMRFNRYALLLEHLLFEPSGTARRFILSNNEVSVQCDPQGDEASNNEVVFKIQKKALEYAHSQQVKYLSIGSRIITLFENVYFSPQERDGKVLGCLCDVDAGNTKYLRNRMEWQFCDETDDIVMIKQKIYDFLKAVISKTKERFEKC